MQRADAGKAGGGRELLRVPRRGCLRVLLGAALAVAVAVSAQADPDNERARALWPETLRQVLEGYAAYERGDAAGAVAAWGPIASDAPHRVQYLLASLLLTGRGVEANPALAADILREAAGHGHADGQYLLGLALRVTGAGAEAARWLARAARQEHGPALLALGQLYEEGDGVARDLFEAYVHYARAVRLGHPDARARAGATWLQLTPAQQAAAGARLLSPPP